MDRPLTDAERAARYRRRHPDRIRASAARRNRLRVWVGQWYVGYTHRPESADVLNEVIRKEHRARKQQSRT